MRPLPTRSSFAFSLSFSSCLPSTFFLSFFQHKHQIIRGLYSAARSPHYITSIAPNTCLPFLFIVLIHAASYREPEEQEEPRTVASDSPSSLPSLPLFPQSFHPSFPASFLCCQLPLSKTKSILVGCCPPDHTPDIYDARPPAKRWRREETRVRKANDADSLLDRISLSLSSSDSSSPCFEKPEDDELDNSTPQNLSLSRLARIFPVSEHTVRLCSTLGNTHETHVEQGETCQLHPCFDRHGSPISKPARPLPFSPVHQSPPNPNRIATSVALALSDRPRGRSQAMH